MTEIEAAIARVQLRKLESLIRRRVQLAEYLTRVLSDLPGLILPTVKPDCTHVYYRYAIQLDPRIIPVPAPLLVRILNAEGMHFYSGYEPLYLQPLYQEKVFYPEKNQVSYDQGICPVAERLQLRVLSTEAVRPPLTFRDMDEIAQAFAKVLASPEELLRKAHAEPRQKVPSATQVRV